MANGFGGRLGPKDAGCVPGKLDASLAVFASLPELRDLHISGDRVADAGLAHLKGLANLRYLNIS